MNDQNKIKQLVTPTDIMSLENREAYLKLPGNLPISKIKLAPPIPKFKCPDFIPIAGYKTPEAIPLPARDPKESVTQV